MMSGSTRGWYAVRCVFGEVGSETVDEQRDWTYEERITLWTADSFDAALSSAEAEAGQYASASEVTYLGFAQVFQLSGPVTEGAEVFSVLRSSNLGPNEYLEHFFEAGLEHERIERGQ
jgi:hypothetical protein